MKMKWRAEGGETCAFYTCLWLKDSAMRNTKGYHMPLGEAVYSPPALVLSCLAPLVYRDKAS
jgi:hypothetical protein